MRTTWQRMGDAWLYLAAAFVCRESADQMIERELIGLAWVLILMSLALGILTIRSFWLSQEAKLKGAGNGKDD